jgi:hypothetical protein
MISQVHGHQHPGRSSPGSVCAFFFLMLLPPSRGLCVCLMAFRTVQEQFPDMDIVPATLLSGRSYRCAASKRFWMLATPAGPSSLAKKPGVTYKVVAMPTSKLACDYCSTSLFLKGGELPEFKANFASRGQPRVTFVWGK